MDKSFTALAISKEKIERLENSLVEFCSRAQIVWALLITSTGHLLIQRGFVMSYDVLGISALACGVFNSTMELARIIGEKKFDQFLQEGSKFSIYYNSISDDYLLVTMYDDRTIPGVVGVAMKEFAHTARKILAS